MFSSAGMRAFAKRLRFGDWGREKRADRGRGIASGKFCGLQSKEEKEKDDI